MRWAGVLTAIFALIACGSRRASAPPPPEPIGCPPPSGASSTVATADVIPRPEDQLSAGVVERSPVATRVVDGPFRAEVAPGGAIELASDRFATAIRGIVHLRDAWTFVSADGVVAGSDTYLGPLRRLGQAKPGFSNDHSRCRGRMTIIDDTVETTDGVTPLRPLPSPPPGIVRRAAFRDADHGLVIREGGDAFATDDGGQSYHRIDLGEVAIIDVTCENDAFILDTSRGRRKLDGNRILTLPPPNPDRAEAERLDAIHAQIAVEDRVRAAELLRFATLNAPTRGEIIAGKPTIAISPPRAPAVLVPVDGSSLDALTRQLHDTASPHTSSGERVSDALCAIRPWGPNLALVCPDGLDRYEPTTGHSTRVATTRDGWYARLLITSSDGVHAAYPCGDVRRDDRRWCVVTPTGVAKTGAITDEPFAMIGDRFAVRRGGALSLVDPATSAAESVAISPPAPNVRVDGLGRASDGTVIAYAGGWFARMRSGALDWRKLPDGASGVDFADDRRGIARGAELAAIWVTDDGGASWRAIQPRVDGALHDTRWPREIRHATVCLDSHCTIDDRVIVTFGGVDLRGAHVLGAYDCPATPPPPRADDRWLACTVAGTRKIAARGRGEDYLLDEHGRTEIARDNVFATLAVTPAGSRHHWEVAWEGRDALGTYRGTAAGEVPVPKESHITYQLHHASREGVAIYAEDYYWLPAGGRPFRIEMDDELLAAPNGDVAVLFYIDDEHQRVRRVVVHDRTGKTLATRDLPDTYRPLRLGWLDGRFVVQILEEDGRQRTAIAVTGSREPVALRDAWFHAPICHHPPGTKAMILGAAGMVDIDQYARNIERIVVDPGDTPCLAAVIVGKLGHDGSQVFATAGADGALHSDYERGSELQELACRRN